MVLNKWWKLVMRATFIVSYNLCALNICIYINSNSTFIVLAIDHAKRQTLRHSIISTIIKSFSLSIAALLSTSRDFPGGCFSLSLSCFRCNETTKFPACFSVFVAFSFWVVFSRYWHPQPTNQPALSNKLRWCNVFVELILDRAFAESQHKRRNQYDYGAPDHGFFYK